MDKVFIKDLAVACIVGIYPHERSSAQTIHFDISASFDNSHGAHSENIDQTVNYHAIAEAVRAYVASSEFLLLETLVEAVASIILQDFQVASVKVRVAKRQVIDQVGAVGVRIKRYRHDCLQTALVGLGSNINALLNIKTALKLLAQQFGELKISNLYQNPAQGFAGDDFINAAVSFSTCYSASVIYSKLREIEVAMGRTDAYRKFSARNIDLDFLALDENIIDLPNLKLPRPKLATTAYSLAPAADIYADFIHPIAHKSYANLWHEFEQNNAQLASQMTKIDPAN